MITVCPKCQKQGQVRGGDELVGRNTKCSCCSEIFTINTNKDIEEEKKPPQQSAKPIQKAESQVR